MIRILDFRREINSTLPAVHSHRYQFLQDTVWPQMCTFFGQRLQRFQHLIAHSLPRIVQILNQQMDLIGNVDEGGTRELRQGFQNDDDKTFRRIFGQQVKAQSFHKRRCVCVMVHMTKNGNKFKLHTDRCLQRFYHCGHFRAHTYGECSVPKDIRFKIGSYIRWQQLTLTVRQTEPKQIRPLPLQHYHDCPMHDVLNDELVPSRE
jgi:hypothetical protein